MATTSSTAKTPTTDQNKDVSLFVKKLWFFMFYFILLMMIASFGIIAEV